MYDSKKFFSEMKKGNFHLHVTGSLFPADLREIAKLVGVEVAQYEPLEEQYAVFENPAVWSLAKEITSTEKGLSQALKKILERERKDNVIYAEVTINPFGMKRRGLTDRQIVKILCETDQIASEAGLKIVYKFGVNRKDGWESVLVVAESFLNCPEYLRCTVDLNGDERIFPTSDFVDAFRELSERGIPTSIHAGEYPEDSVSMRDALEAHPRRIAHGLASLHSEEMLTEMARRNIAVETATISNLQRGLLNTNKPLPIQRFREFGIVALPGTDDPAFFKNHISDEYLAMSSRGIGKEDIIRINSEALAVAGLT
jgi:adenosine deaminase